MRYGEICFGMQTKNLKTYKPLNQLPGNSPGEASGKLPAAPGKLPRGSFREAPRGQASGKFLGSSREAPLKIP